MEYRVLIFISNERLSAIDIDTTGKTDGISIDGNDVMTYKSEKQINEFCQYIKEYYNINSFSDIEMSITVLRFDAVMENVFVLLEQIRDVGECNLISVEKVLPWIAWKEGLIKEGTTIPIKTFDKIYTVSLGEDMVLKCLPGGAEEHSILLPVEKFSGYAHLSKKVLAGYEDEKNELCKKFDIESSDLKKQIKELENQLLVEKNKTKKVEDSLSKITSAVYKIREEKGKSTNRYICKFEEKSCSNNFNISFMKMIANEINFQIEYSVDNADVVKKKQKIAVVHGYCGDEGRSDFDTVITAAAEGRVYRLLDSNTTIKDGDAVALIGDLSDNKEDIMQWYDKNK